MSVEYYIFGIYFYITYLLYKYIISPCRIFILFYCPNALIYHYNKYVDLDDYDVENDEDVSNAVSTNIKCKDSQIYIVKAYLLSSDLSKHYDITNKIILLVKMQNRVNVNDIYHYCINESNNEFTHFYLRYVNANQNYINKYININEKINILTNKKLLFGDVCS